MDDSTQYHRPRLVTLLKWHDFNGFGFNLHAEKGKAGQFIGKIDEDSPAEACTMREGDRIVEIDGVNIGNENHQQVVSRIKAAGSRVTMLVVDPITDNYYKERKIVVRNDMDNISVHICPSHDSPDEPATISSEPEPSPPSYDHVLATDKEETVHEAPVESSTAVVEHAVTNGYSEEVSSSAVSSPYYVRLCHIVKRSDFNGYGFNLHAERGKPGQYIGEIDPNSPAEHANLKEKDRIIEVDGENVESASHAATIERIKGGGNQTRLLVVDPESDRHLKDNAVSINGGMSGIEYCSSETKTDTIDIDHSEEITPSPENAEPPHSETNEVSENAEPSHSETIEVSENAEPSHSETNEISENNNVTDKVENKIENSEPVSNDSTNGIAVATTNEVSYSTNTYEPEPEPEPAPEPVKVAEPVKNVSGDDPFNMSAAQMRARIASKKKNDPRIRSIDMSTKKNMFEKL